MPAVCRVAFSVFFLEAPAYALTRRTPSRQLRQSFEGELLWDRSVRFLRRRPDPNVKRHTCLQSEPWLPVIRPSLNREFDGCFFGLLSSSWTAVLAQPSRRPWRGLYRSRVRVSGVFVDREDLVERTGCGRWRAIDEAVHICCFHG